ncbi:unnamed protein product [Ceratitis capitata]|uniref:(Mediterranean fruit fly) hypothetical protein n=1 Tax=Ceratitis capitata TaxID=7213 RepID=A0A811U3Z3_CERCA|nr:unnamed protein product [Ceratitis capitata]
MVRIDKDLPLDRLKLSFHVPTLKILEINLDCFEHIFEENVQELGGLGASEHRTVLLLNMAIHNWNGDVRYGLPIDVGDSVEILEECKNWYRGTCARKSRAVGIFPKTYIHIKDLSKIDPVVAECTQVLREWSEIWKKLFVDRETYKFHTLRKVMLSILECRRELLGATLTQDQTLELQTLVVSRIDWGNR